MPPTIWKYPLKWAWTYDEEPGAGGTEYSASILPEKIAWNYSEDRWGRSGEQSYADFAEFGPLWECPDEVKAEMAAHFGLANRTWQAPGYRDYSPVWWKVDPKKEDEALALLTGAEAGRRYHGQRTLLMLAAEEQAGKVVARLLELGADARARDEYGKTALMAACWQTVPSVGILQLLLDHAAEVNAQDGNGKTALMLLCSTTNPALTPVKLLLDHGADARLRDSEGRSALDYLLTGRKAVQEVVDLVTCRQ